MAKSVTIDGKTFEVADDVAAALAKGSITDTLTAAAKGLTDATAALAIEKARADVAEKAATDAKAALDAAEKAKPTADQIAAMAAELVGVIDAAKVVAPKIETKGKSADAIKREAVTAVLGDAATKDKGADYINAAFDLIARKEKDADPVAVAIAKGTQTGDAGQKAAAAYDARMAAAWQH